MTDSVFKLGTFTRDGAKPFVGLVFGEYAVALGDLMAVGATALPASAAFSMLDLLEDWNRNFDALVKLAAKAASARHQALSTLKVLAPVPRPSKILCSAANYSGHLAEMKKFTSTGSGVEPSKVYAGDKSTSQAYLFLKAPSAVTGPYDDIVLPDNTAHQIDWEAELGVVIGDRARRVSEADALRHVAGFIVFNDVSCRDVLFRPDRPNFKTDWLSSKSFDSFAPSGPFLVPRAFVADHKLLHVTLKLNGEIKQDGLAGDMIYSPEEQIEYASKMMTLEPGDIFATGTLGGVGQGSGTFLKPGDVIETEIEGLGCQRNKVVAGRH